MRRIVHRDGLCVVHFDAMRRHIASRASKPFRRYREVGLKQFTHDLIASIKWGKICGTSSTVFIASIAWRVFRKSADTS
jgi:hypothetical protein